MKRHTAVTVLIASSILAISRCSGYRLGSSLPEGINSVHVPAFKNTSGEPQIDTEATSATLEEFQRDGTLEVADASFADTMLEVTITKYKLAPVRYDREKRKTTAEYRLRIDAEITFSKVATGEVLQKRSVFGETIFPTGGDLTSAKRESTPDACEDLAHQIVKAVVEHW